MPDGTGPTTYTAVTFAPVQSFIRSSRKLRDLYGSSLLLSHLARALHDDAEARLQPLGGFVISPAGVSISRGVPNSLILHGAYSEAQARQALLAAWRQVLKACRDWLEANIRISRFPEKPEGWTGDWEAGWGASWKAVALHSWELFHGQGATISAARQALALNKQQRDWSLPNWTGESSTLSSAEAVVRPTMGRVIDPRHLSDQAAKQEARALIQQLRDKLGDAFADENEEISLLELVKRLITYRPVLVNAFALQERPSEVEELLQKGFPHLSTHQPLESAEKPESIIWFMADGDRIGTHLDRLANQSNEEGALQEFSHSIRSWASSLYEKVPQAMDDPTFSEEERRATVVMPAVTICLVLCTKLGRASKTSAAAISGNGSPSSPCSGRKRVSRISPCRWGWCGQKPRFPSAKHSSTPVMLRPAPRPAAATASPYASCMPAAPRWTGLAPGPGSSRSVPTTATVNTAAVQPPAGATSLMIWSG